VVVPGIESIDGPTPMGHEYAGIVEDAGSDVRAIRPGQFVIGSFFASDNTCPHRGGPLGEGDILGSEIVCPWHLWSFDVATGVCAGVPELCIVTHEVRVDGGRILVKLSPVRETTDRLL